MSILAIVYKKGVTLVIGKPFTSSPFIPSLQALNLRLSFVHLIFQKLQQALKIKEAGNFGEHYIMKELNRSSQHQDSHVLHNVYCPQYSPCKSIFWSLPPKGLIILEVKNIKGQVHFKKTPVN